MRRWSRVATMISSWSAVTCSNWSWVRISIKRFSAIWLTRRLSLHRTDLDVWNPDLGDFNLTIRIQRNLKTGSGSMKKHRIRIRIRNPDHKSSRNGKEEPCCRCDGTDRHVRDARCEWGYERQGRGVGWTTVDEVNFMQDNHKQLLRRCSYRTDEHQLTVIHTHDVCGK